MFLQVISVFCPRCRFLYFYGDYRADNANDLFFLGCHTIQGDLILPQILGCLSLFNSFECVEMRRDK